MQVKTIIFDKTGTLTHGKPIVTSVMMYVSEAVCSSRLFAALVGLAEANSEHPLGQAVVNYAKTVSVCTWEYTVIYNVHVYCLVKYIVILYTYMCSVKYYFIFMYILYM